MASRHSSVRRAFWVAAALVVLAAGAFSLGAGGQDGSQNGEIRGDVRVAGISLEGHTREQARQRLEAAVQLREIRLSGAPGEKDITLEAEEAGIDFDDAATAGEAYAVGREGGFLRRLSERISSATGAVRIEPVVSHDREILEARIDRAVSGIERDPADASVEVAGTEARLTEGQPGYEVDAAATAENVERAVSELETGASLEGRRLEPEVTTEEARAAAEAVREAASGPLVLSAAGGEWTVSPAQVASAVEVQRSGGELRAGLEKGGLGPYIGGMYEVLHREPEEASYEISGAKIQTIPSSEGRRVDDAELFAALERGLFEGKHRYDAPMIEEEPKITTRQAERHKPTELIGEYRTPYTATGDTSAERLRNLMKSSGAVDGAVVAPGEVFSFNELAADLDYEAAKVIVDGQAVTEAGGGLCQVSSTLYNAANDAGLRIVERAPHSAELPYIRPGLDATVWFGSNGTQELDMKFENTTGSNILIRETVRDDGYVYAEIWGRPTGKEVELSSERVSAGAGSTSWVTHRTVKEDGEPVSRQRFHTDTYEPLTDEGGDPIPNSGAAPAEW